MKVTDGSHSVWMDSLLGGRCVDWKQVRGPAGAVTCETRDFGIKWPQWHTLLFEGQVPVDIRVVCPQDAKTMLQKTSQDGPPEEMGSKARV